MPGVPQNVADMLARLAENSQNELDLIRRLADAIRRADDQVLREVRSVTLQHEMRREAIFTELQTLAGRLCALPARPNSTPSPSIEQQHQRQPAIDLIHSHGGGDWRQAAQAIDEELEFTFNGAGNHH